MLRRHAAKWMLLLVIIAAVGVGMTIGQNNQKLTTQTAIAQTTNDDFHTTDDYKYLERTNRAFIELVNRAKPAVVQITTKKLSRRNREPLDWFDLFRERPEQRREDDDVPREVPGGLGSGVIVSEDGYILTNNHVIEEAEDITVILSNGREYKAELVGTDSGDVGTDLAVLKIDDNYLPALSFGDSEALEVGEWVVAVGSPFGLSQTVTRGIVSAKGRSTNVIRAVSYADFIQTDAPINRGNSGGALINIRGELVGINTAIFAGGLVQGNVGIGFAIPSNLAKRIMTELTEKGKVERGWLGVGIDQELTYDLAQEFKLDEPRGALITKVYPESPAEKGGIKRGDVIIEFNQVPIRDRDHLRHVVAATEVGKKVQVKIVREGKEKMLNVNLGKRTQEVLASLEDNRSPFFGPGREGGNIFTGLYVRTLTDELAQRYGHEGEKGVIVIDVERSSPAARASIQAGDLIQEIERKDITDEREYYKRTKEIERESKVMLYVKSAHGRGRYLTLKNTLQLDDK